MQHLSVGPAPREHEVEGPLKLIPFARVIDIVPATTLVTFAQMDAGNHAGHSQILVTSVPTKSPLVVSHQKASAGSGALS